ncbi:type II toxin-antitoxin system VapC family toxin [Aquibium oceanicum]|uniref:VapC toxin family PIN domain ribonuclease n=1 Tax=Aquibium oceanicum TaxID=1670800 RepID=A0A1L3SWY2_9HYPH|nr:type II toxin-antitoxin system VapC family toxin [Aquibium oceanicum]APH73908.1 VapC toxin family PIN domain ribonuclease [Aquibium oceanicum]
MFVDASALTAMLAEEADGAELMTRMRRSRYRMTSAIAVWEASVALSRLTEKSVTETRMTLERFLDLAEIRTLPLPPEIAAIALDAFDRFGKGRHPARLNMGDCFAYACARHFGQPLLFKGSDFPLTDIAAA